MIKQLNKILADTGLTDKSTVRTLLAVLADQPELEFDETSQGIINRKDRQIEILYNALTAMQAGSVELVKEVESRVASLDSIASKAMQEVYNLRDTILAPGVEENVGKSSSMFVADGSLKSQHERPFCSGKYGTSIINQAPATPLFKEVVEKKKEVRQGMGKEIQAAMEVRLSDMNVKFDQVFNGAKKTTLYFAELTNPVKLDNIAVAVDEILATSFSGGRAIVFGTALGPVVVKRYMTDNRYTILSSKKLSDTFQSAPSTELTVITTSTIYWGALEAIFNGEFFKHAKFRAETMEKVASEVVSGKPEAATDEPGLQKEIGETAVNGESELPPTPGETHPTEASASVPSVEEMIEEGHLRS